MLEAVDLRFRKLSSGLVLVLLATTTVAAAHVLQATAAASSSSWPMFQENSQLTGQSPFTGPSTPAVLWNISLPQTEFSSPVLGSDGSIYMAGQSSGGAGELYAYSPDGHSEWNYTLPGADGTIASTPAVGADGTIYLLARSGRLYALNPSGTMKWDLLIQGITAYGSQSSGFTPYCTETPDPSGTSSCPLVIGPGGTIYAVGDNETAVYSVSPSGSLNWKYLISGPSNPATLYPPSVGPDGTLYAIGVDTAARPEAWHLEAISSSGTLKWEVQLSAPSSSPVVGPNGDIYVTDYYASPDCNYSSCVLAYSSTGSLAWAYNLGTSTAEGGWAPAVRPDGSIVVPTLTSTANYVDQIYALSSGGSYLWYHNVGCGCEHEVLTTDSAGNVYAFGTCAPSQGSCLYSLNSDGSEKWSQELLSGYLYPTAPVIGQNGVIYEADFGRLFAIGQKGTTSTTCAKSTAQVGSSVACTATVSAPGATGNVLFSANNTGTFTPSSGSCTLSSGSCSVQFTPSAGGVDNVSGIFMGDSSAAPSEGTFSLTVSKASSTTTVTCSPSTTNDTASASTCTAAVSGYDPTGTVGWSNNGTGTSFSYPATCTLSSGHCSITGSFYSAGSTLVNASYQGDAANSPSSGTFAVDTKGTSYIHVTCSSSSISVGQGTTCSATVSGDSPTGTVTFTSSTAGKFSSPGSACALSGGTCSVTFTSSAAGVDTLKAAYSGDSFNLVSSQSTYITVTQASSQLAVSCSPTTVSPTSGATCTATVTGYDPSGDVTWSSSLTVTPTACALSSGSCSVQVTEPSSGGYAGSYQVFADYAGDANNAGTSTSVTILAQASGSVTTSSTPSATTSSTATASTSQGTTTAVSTSASAGSSTSAAATSVTSGAGTASQTTGASTTGTPSNSQSQVSTQSNPQGNSGPTTSSSAGAAAGLGAGLVEDAGIGVVAVIVIALLAMMLLRRKSGVPAASPQPKGAPPSPPSPPAQTEPTPGVKFCPHCGQALASDAVFCASCGKSV